MTERLSGIDYNALAALVDKYGEPPVTQALIEIYEQREGLEYAAEKLLEACHTL